MIRLRVLVALIPFALPANAQQFERVFPSVITDAKTNSSGGSWGDYNGDGWEDLMVTNWFGQKNTLIANLGDGEFKWIEDAFPFNDVGESASSRWFDVENDGDLDLLVTNLGQPAFFYLNKEGALLKVTDNGLTSDKDDYRFAGIADYDNDWDLDVLFSTPGEVANVLLRNNGPGAFKIFEDGQIVKDIGDSAPICWGDADDDGDQDLFIGNIAGSNDLLYWNEGTFAFEEEGESPIVTSGGNTLSCAWVDVDNDSDLDLFTTDQAGSNRLFLNEGARRFVRVFNDPLVADRIGGFGSAWGDVENDGDLDVFVANRDGGSTLYLNQGKGSFEPATKEPVSTDGGASVSGAFADYDRDGDLDLFVANDSEQPNFLYRNTGGGNWLSLRLVGDISNAWGIGARITAVASIGGETLKQRRDLSTGADYSQNSLRVHLGFGDAKIVETLVVEWPSGVVNSYKNVPINQYLDVVEGDDTPLPVSLTAFQAVADGDALALAWTTASELNNAGFEVQLAGTGDFEPAGFVSGAGTTNAPQSYTYRISALAPGDYRVRLKQIDFDGAFAYSAARSIRIDATTALRVEPAYPNPFNPSTTVRFAVREASAARAELFDATGRLVRVLHEGVVQGGGVQELEIEGASLPGGLYLVRIAGGGHVSTTPILLVK
ncbi:MAG: FG-GAP-like repeat-containing protein [Rhodothermales bacterium]|nr:FG-GAP-like repeat-containing protein [Rhodothermales bacterium]